MATEDFILTVDQVKHGMVPLDEVTNELSSHQKKFERENGKYFHHALKDFQDHDHVMTEKM